MKPYQFKIYTPYDRPTRLELNKVASFLYTHLEKYGDAKADIIKAIEYAVKISASPGGFALTLEDDGDIIGAVVINKTGMSGYIPENILVYIAVNGDYRGQGLGKKLMQKAMDLTQGAIALHVEPDNPARFLYEKLGFENKYLEMRWSNNKETPIESTTAANTTA
jgi:ribosomal-protein-alanine N-acetyltransferase